MRVREIAELLGASYEGDGEADITAAATIESAGTSELAFAGNRKAIGQVSESKAGCLIVPANFPSLSGRTVIRAEHPRTVFAVAVAHLHPKPSLPAGIHPTAVISPNAQVAPSCSIGPHVAIGDGTRIGSGCTIGAGTVIGSRVSIGEHCTIYANATIHDNVEIGNHATLHSGAVIGADGFGFVLTDGEYQKFPQVGRVTIGDDVEIGANSCIDRAALGVTSIGNGTKLDNMVHIGHNCQIGCHVVIAAQTGLSGGVVVEDYAVIGGQVGIGDKARIQSRAVLGSGSGVLTSKIVRSGEVMWGTPARPLKKYLRQLAAFGRIQELRDEVAALKREITKPL